MRIKGGRSGPDLGLSESIYGHVKRFEWIVRHLASEDRVLKIGCGTGYMVTLPLIRSGWDVMGVDIDAASVGYGRAVLVPEGLDSERLQAVDAATLTGQFDAIILSEVLEHISNNGIRELLAAVSRLLVPGGRLLFTGVRSVTRLNRLLGDVLPSISTAFMVSATQRAEDR